MDHRTPPSDSLERPLLTLPEGGGGLLLHSCCAPCAGDVMAELARSGVESTVLFYNPNIHPRREYDVRKDENKRYADRLGVPFHDLDYDRDDWFARVKGLEMAPERGARCTLCFDMRLERSALWAADNGFTVFTSTLAASRLKDINQVNACGERAAARHAGLRYWTHNWRKKGGAQRMVVIAKELDFYRQQYCGCTYSLRDTNARRRAQGRPPVATGAASGVAMGATPKSRVS